MSWFATSATEPWNCSRIKPVPAAGPFKPSSSIFWSKRHKLGDVAAALAIADQIRHELTG